MKRYRLPRKLKKGCLTLSGNPRTRWQRKGRIYTAKLLKSIANTACAAAVSMDILGKIAKRINPVLLPPGGFAVPQPERMTVGEQAGEMILHRPQLDQLRHLSLIHI